MANVCKDFSSVSTVKKDASFKINLADSAVIGAPGRMLDESSERLRLKGKAEEVKQYLDEACLNEGSVKK